MKYRVGLFFEKVVELDATDIVSARKQADKLAEGIAEKEELTITELVVLQPEPDWSKRVFQEDGA